MAAYFRPVVELGEPPRRVKVIHRVKSFTVQGRFTLPSGLQALATTKVKISAAGDAVILGAALTLTGAAP